MRILILGLALLATPVLADVYDDRAARILKASPLIDGHNDWPETLRGREGEGRWTIDLSHDLARRPVPYNTDIARLRQGQVGGQFWSVYVSANQPEEDQVIETLEQIDLVKQIVARYPDTFELATTAADVRRIHKAGRIASLIGVEGGGQIDQRLAILRTYKALGAGYLTLTHAKTIAWADSATDAPQHDGLTPFGEAVVHELNRIGMLVDLSHVSAATMKDALRVTRAPVIFSHSSSRALVGAPRNVPDDVLALVKANGGVVMVNYYASFVSDAYRQRDADHAAEAARLKSLYPGDPDRAATLLAEWGKAHPRPKVTIDQVADHMQHVVDVAGIDHVGIGSDYDGVDNELPEGLGDVSTYPALIATMLRRGWSDADAAKLAGGNVLRVMEAAERVAAAMKSELPGTATLAALDTPPAK